VCRGCRSSKSRASVGRRAIPSCTAVEVVLPADQVDAAIEAIIAAAKTDKIGDGKIFVTPVEQAIRIRTGETGLDAV